jgi:hypothetical protein
MYRSHSLDEWLAMICLALSIFEACSVPYHLTVDADLCDFDPRPAVRRALPVVHERLVFAGHDVNRAIGTGQRVVKHCAKKSAAAPREAAISLAAFLLLLSGPEATR